MADLVTERIRLLVHILKLIIEPYERQCPAVQKLRLNVRKLEEVTMEAMTSWFNDPDHMENLSKKPFLKEIFKVAKAEERYKNGEIGKWLPHPILDASDHHQTGTRGFPSCTETEVASIIPMRRSTKA
jgi:hypothetical protein